MDARKRQEKTKCSLVLGGDLQRKGRLESETVEGQSHTETHVHPAEDGGG